MLFRVTHTNLPHHRIILQEGSVFLCSSFIEEQILSELNISKERDIQDNISALKEQISEETCGLYAKKLDGQWYIQSFGNVSIFLMRDNECCLLLKANQHAHGVFKTHDVLYIVETVYEEDFRAAPKELLSDYVEEYTSIVYEEESNKMAEVLSILASVPQPTQKTQVVSAPITQPKFAMVKMPILGEHFYKLIILLFIIGFGILFNNGFLAKGTQFLGEYKKIEALLINAKTSSILNPETALMQLSEAQELLKKSRSMAQKDQQHLLIKLDAAAQEIVTVLQKKEEKTAALFYDFALDDKNFVARNAKLLGNTLYITGSDTKHYSLDVIKKSLIKTASDASIELQLSNAKTLVQLSQGNIIVDKANVQELQTVQDVCIFNTLAFVVQNEDIKRLSLINKELKSYFLAPLKNAKLTKCFVPKSGSELFAINNGIIEKYASAKKQLTFKQAVINDAFTVDFLSAENIIAGFNKTSNILYIFNANGSLVKQIFIQNAQDIVAIAETDGKILLVGKNGIYSIAP
jgi:hypothetical protein